MEAAERLAKQKLDLRQNADKVGERQELVALDSKLDRAVTMLNTKSLDTGTAEDKAMQQAKSLLGQAKASLLQMHMALDSQQKSDTVVIKGEVHRGVDALRNKVISSIRQASQKIQSELDQKIAGLSSDIGSMNAKVTSAEQELQDKMTALKRNEASHDAAQERVIASMKANLLSGTEVTVRRSEELATNITIVKRLMKEGLAALEGTNDEDKPQVLAAMDRAVTAAKIRLNDLIAQTKAEEKKAIRDRLQAWDTSLAAERAAEQAKEQLLDATIRSMSQGDTNFDAAWAGDVSTIGEQLRHIRISAHRNNTEIHDALAASETALARKQVRPTLHVPTCPSA